MADFVKKSSSFLNQDEYTKNIQKKIVDLNQAILIFFLKNSSIFWVGQKKFVNKNAIKRGKCWTRSTKLLDSNQILRGES